MKENNKPILTYYFDFECALYKDKTVSLENKAAQAWGILTASCHSGEINWDTQRQLFGELMSKLLNLNLHNY